ncbi:MAG: hypothetical protein WAV38_20610 [Xanthobacteraceae bacterium]
MTRRPTLSLFARVALLTLGFCTTRARLDQIINLKHELVQLAAKIDWQWIDREIAPLYSDNPSNPFMKL